MKEKYPKRLPMSLIKVLTTCGILLVLIGLPLTLWISHYRERDAAHRIRLLGGKVSFEHHRLLRDVMDAEMMQSLTRVSYVSLESPRVTNHELRHISSLTALRYLSLNGTQISDEGLRDLTRLVNLYTLDLRRPILADRIERQLSRFN